MICDFPQWKEQLFTNGATMHTSHLKVRSCLISLLLVPNNMVACESLSRDNECNRTGIRAQQDNESGKSIRGDTGSNLELLQRLEVKGLQRCPRLSELAFPSSWRTIERIQGKETLESRFVCVASREPPSRWDHSCSNCSCRHIEP